MAHPIQTLSILIVLASGVLASDSRPICPCAWIERGGVWSDRKYFTFGGRRVDFISNRCDCEGDVACTMGWTEYGMQALTFRWIGMPDMRQYIFQMQFCDVVQPVRTRYCQHHETAYTLMQTGTWLYLIRLYCQCIYRQADIKTFIYGNPMTPSSKEFRARYMDLTCNGLRLCDPGRPCYREKVYPDGKLRKGSVLCSCPDKEFCPIYYIGGRRQPLLDSYSNRTLAYEVFCQPSLL